MKRVLFFALLAVAFTTNSFSQDKTSDLKELFALMKAESSIDTQMEYMLETLKQQVGGFFQGDDAQAKIDEYLKFVTEETKEMSIQMINNDMVSLYDEAFTDKEIKELIKFYKTPIGQKLVEKTPVITGQISNIMMTKYMPEFQQKLVEKLTELK